MDKIERLLSEANAQVSELQDAALLRLGLLLELNNRPVDFPSSPNFYQEELGDELVALPITPDDQMRIVESLVKTTRGGTINPAVMWVFSKALPAIGMPALLEVVRDSQQQLQGQSLYQMLISLEDLLAYDEMGKPDPTIANSIKRSDIAGFVQRASESKEPRVAQAAARLLQKLSAYVKSD